MTRRTAPRRALVAAVAATLAVGLTAPPAAAQTTVLDSFITRGAGQALTVQGVQDSPLLADVANDGPEGLYAQANA